MHLCIKFNSDNLKTDEEVFIIPKNETSPKISLAWNWFLTHIILCKVVQNKQSISVNQLALIYVHKQIRNRKTNGVSEFIFEPLTYHIK